MSISKKGLVFGKIAVKKGFISKEDLKQCIKRQKELAEQDGPQPSLIDMLLEDGYLTEEQVEKIENARNQSNKQNEITGYEIHEKLGEGATGAVYKATQLSLDRPVAIKVLYPSVVKDETYLKRFHREARSVAKLNHKNIIQGYDVGEEDGVHYFVMEYVEGETLREHLEEEDQISEQEALHIGIQMARALGHADEHGLIHRDIKPENIMLSRDEEAKLCDLGLAKTTDSQESTVTQEDTVIGTPHYMSPEQAMGEELDIRTDFYALGASLYHAITADVPFKAEKTATLMRKQAMEPLVPPSERNPEISEGVSSLIEKMMEKSPEDRHQTPDELRTDFERLLDDKTTAQEKKNRNGESPSSRGRKGHEKPEERSRLNEAKKVLKRIQISKNWLIAVIGAGVLLALLILLFRS